MEINLTVVLFCLVIRDAVETFPSDLKTDRSFIPGGISPHQTAGSHDHSDPGRGRRLTLAWAPCLLAFVWPSPCVQVCGSKRWHEAAPAPSWAPTAVPPLFTTLLRWPPINTLSSQCLLGSSVSLAAHSASSHIVLWLWRTATLTTPINPWLSVIHRPARPERLRCTKRFRRHRQPLATIVFSGFLSLTSHQRPPCSLFQSNV